MANKRDKLLALAEGSQIELFTDQYGLPFMRAPAGQARKVLSLAENNDGPARDWLRWLAFGSNLTVSESPLRDAVSTLRARALFREQVHPGESRQLAQRINLDRHDRLSMAGAASRQRRMGDRQLSPHSL
jgi:hypothetical protein